MRVAEQILKFFSNAGWFRHTGTCISLIYQLSTVWLKSAPAISHCCIYSRICLCSDWLVHGFCFSNLGEEFLSQSEFTVVQTQHFHSTKQMGHLRRRRWSRGGGTGKHSLNISFLLKISKYTCTCTHYIQYMHI